MTTAQHGALEVFFTYPSDVNKFVKLTTNIQGLKQFSVSTAMSDISVVITSTVSDGIVFTVTQVYLGASVIDQSDFSTYQGSAVNFAVRIFFFDQFLSVSVNDKWISSYAFADIAYAPPITATLIANNGSIAFTNIRRVELADGREAVYVDYESTTDNAIQSVIQQRPVQVLPHVNRKLTFTYAAEKDTLEAVFVSKYTERVSHPNSLSSDGLVYFADVGISIDEETAKEVGLLTKLYRLSELDTGAEAAAATLQKRAREERTKRTINMRLDPRIELTDVLHLSLTVLSTNRVLDDHIIVEEARISLRDGDANMTISGRKQSGS